MPDFPTRMSTRSDWAKTASRHGNVERTGDGIAVQNEKPGLPFRLQPPIGVWRQLDPLQHEVGAGDEKRPLVAEPVRPHPKTGRAGVSHRDCALDVQLALAAVIEQTERRVAALLDLRNDEPGADRVYRSCRHGNGVIRSTVRHATRSAIEPSSTAWRSCWRREPPIEADSDLGSGCGTQDVPGFGLAVRQPIDCAYASSGWTWMDSGSLVNSSLSSSEGVEAGLPGRSYQISPIGTASWAA